MSEKVIKNNQSLVPFLGDRLSFIRGLDPLGLQNTSDATFSMLLPGLNNVTGRIRYYSFYCWLLDEYSKQIGSTNPKDQQQFIRRAEYIIALASTYISDDVSSIPGSLYAGNQITKDLNKVHSLQTGTYQSNGSTTNTYWKYPSGAFGQYYFGSLSDMGIVHRRDNNAGIFIRSNHCGDDFVSGEALALSFNTNIDNEVKSTFFKCLNIGEISEAQLASLLPNFNLTKVPLDTEEQKLLISLLLQKDYPLRIEEEPKTHRRNTIKHLREYMKSYPHVFNDRSFIYKCYANKGLVNNEKEATVFGWYYYQFNEYWHYANTAIFNGSLAYLEKTSGPRWQVLKSFLVAVTQRICEEFRVLNLISSSKDTLDSLLILLNPNEQKFLDFCHKSNSIKRAANGFLLTFSLYLNQKNELFSLKEYSALYNLGKDGEGTHYLLNEFDSKKALAIEQYIFEYLFKHIIYRHQYVAFRKIRGGSQSTQKFIIEDHHIRYLGNFEPGFTGPRIGNLISFLKDLNFITADSFYDENDNDLSNELNNGNN